jgi:hypothetical protein
MTELYHDRSIWKRSAAYVGIVIVAMLWGVWELWRAWHGPAAEASTGTMFGVLFLGGGAYSLYQLNVDWRDLVVSLTRDDITGMLTATLWQPTGPLMLTAGPGEIRNWRSHVKIARRNARTFFIYADHPRHPRPLRFDLKPGTDVEGLRSVAPEAVADYETAIGKPGQPKAVS